MNNLKNTNFKKILKYFVKNKRTKLFIRVFKILKVNIYDLLFY